MLYTVGIIRKKSAVYSRNDKEERAVGMIRQKSAVGLIRKKSAVYRRYDEEKC